MEGGYSDGEPPFYILHKAIRQGGFHYMTKNRLKKERLGAVNKNKYGALMEVVEYRGARDVTVQFEQGNLTKTTWHDFNKGSVRNVYDRTLYGIGYIGEGSHKAYEGSKQTPQYSAWTAMMKRSYSSKFHEIDNSYRECIVDEKWHNFQEFAEWYGKNYYEVEGDRVCLDKDILVKGNQRYSQDTCIFVPNRINILFVTRKSQRGSLPIGVNPYRGKFKAKFNTPEGTKYIGVYDSAEEAFRAYKGAKEAYIRRIAEEYKSKIPDKLYRALHDYEVDKDD